MGRIDDCPPAGKVVEIPYTDMQDRRGKRLALGRRASGKGFKVDIRYDEERQTIAARKSAEPLPPREKKPPTNGRRRRNQPAGEPVGMTAATSSVEGEEG